MIKKIELKIFLIIFVLLSFIIGAVIILNTYNSYNLTINGIALYAERLYEDKRIIGREPEGFYAIKIANNSIVEEDMYDDEIKSIVRNIIDKKIDTGIIDKYIYRNRHRIEIDKARWNNYFA